MIWIWKSWQIWSQKAENRLILQNKSGRWSIDNKPKTLQNFQMCLKIWDRNSGIDFVSSRWSLIKIWNLLTIWPISFYSGFRMTGRSNLSWCAIPLCGSRREKPMTGWTNLFRSSKGNETRSVFQHRLAARWIVRFVPQDKWGLSAAFPPGESWRRFCSSPGFSKPKGWSSTTLL